MPGRVRLFIARAAVPFVPCLLLAALRPACACAELPSAPSTEDDNGSLVVAAARQSLRAGIVLVDGVYNTELTAPYDVFEHTRAHLDPGLGIEVVTLSPDGRAVRSAEGLRILVDHAFDGAPSLDILVVPSAEGSRDRDLESEALIAFVRRAGSSAHLVMSLCWGAFVLAEAGLLEGIVVTTFPADYETFARRFPSHDLRVNLSFAHDGKAITSAGGARSFEAALHLVELLYGSATARRIAAGLLVDWPRQPAPAMGTLVTEHALRSLGASREHLPARTSQPTPLEVP